MGGGQQGVQDDGLVAPGGQGVDDVRADEPGSSGDEYAHTATLGRRGGPGTGARPGVMEP
ncbi:hypothetical protein GCM10023237_44810 [Streptomyces coeruleoprunus]